MPRVRDRQERSQNRKRNRCFTGRKSKGPSKGGGGKTKKVESKREGNMASTHHRRSSTGYQWMLTERSLNQKCHRVLPNLLILFLQMSLRSGNRKAGIGGGPGLFREEARDPDRVTATPRSKNSSRGNERRESGQLPLPATRIGDFDDDDDDDDLVLDSKCSIQAENIRRRGCCSSAHGE